MDKNMLRKMGFFVITAFVASAVTAVIVCNLERRGDLIEGKREGSMTGNMTHKIRKKSEDPMPYYSAMLNEIELGYQALKKVYLEGQGRNLCGKSQYRDLAIIHDHVVEIQIDMKGIWEVLDLFQARFKQPEAITPSEDAVIQKLIVYLVRVGDRSSLIELLASYCPERIYLYNYIEFYLVSTGSKTLPDPILVLFDAYDRSDSPLAKKRIVDAFHRAFIQVKVPEGKEEAYVEACRQWYLANKDTLCLNDEYIHKAMLHEHQAEKNGLFVKKTSTGEK